MIKDIYKKHKKIIIIAHLICILVICMFCYTHAQPTKDERVFIFVTGQKYMKEDLKIALEELGEDNGILDVSSFGYDEYDSSFSQAFATKGFYSSDLFIMSKTVFDTYKTTNTFRTLPSEIVSLSDNWVVDDSGNIIAIAINEEFFIAIGNKSAKSNDLMQEFINYIILNGDDLFE